MNKIKELAPGIALCLLVALPCWWLGKMFPIIGGPVFAILCGMIITLIYASQSIYAKRNFLHIQENPAAGSHPAWFWFKPDGDRACWHNISACHPIYHFHFSDRGICFS